MVSVDKMEDLARNYIETLANNQGYFNLSGKDFGTDLHITKYNIHDRGGYKRRLTSPRQVHIQLKSVLEHNVRLTNSTLNFDLETKNYDDLIDRKEELGFSIPLILVVFVLPSDESKWIEVTPENLTIRKSAFWYYPEEELKSYSKNANTQVVKIPRSNLIDSDFFPMIFQYFS